MAQGRRAGQADGERAATRRVVLEQLRVVLPPDPEHFTGAMQDGEIVEAWVVRDEQEGTQSQAIKAYAKPGTPEQRPGTFKAIPVRAWRGGERYSAPQGPPPLRREAID